MVVWMAKDVSSFVRVIILTPLPMRVDWRANKRHGRGIMHFTSGATYNGEFQDDFPCGRGVLTLAWYGN